MTIEQPELPGMPEYPVHRTEGALVTVWRNPETGYHQATVCTWDVGGGQVVTEFEDAGPFDVTEAVKVHQDHLRLLHLL